MMPTEHFDADPVTAPRRRKKYFSIEEANRALPYVRRVMQDLITTYRQAVRARKLAEESDDDRAAQDLAAEYEKLIDRLNDLDKELRHVGAQLKDVHAGLVDFPAVHQGREVCLCWRFGEKAIQAWHETDAGFAGRQSLARLEAPARAVT